MIGCILKDLVEVFPNNEYEFAIDSLRLLDT